VAAYRQRLKDAREFLADHLGDETYHFEEDDDEKAQPWWHARGDYVDALPLDDPRLAQIAEYLTPFLDDDERVECTMDPGGATITYIEDPDWGGDHDLWLTGFVKAPTHGPRRVAASAELQAVTIVTASPGARAASCSAVSRFSTPTASFPLRRR
jgi:hypothetical protein